LSTCARNIADARLRQEERASLEGTELARSASVMLAHLREQYDTLFPHMFAAAPRVFPRRLFTREAFLWAHAAYSSRCFPRSFLPAAGGGDAADVLDEAAPGDSAEEEGVLIPLLDVANHVPEGADMCVQPCHATQCTCADGAACLQPVGQCKRQRCAEALHQGAYGHVAFRLASHLTASRSRSRRLASR
jgi:hypothetical protein